MIPRYSRPEMTAIWEPETRYRIWFEIEAHATDAHGRARRDPDARPPQRCGMARDVEIDVAAIDAIEAVTKHDVIAFLTRLAEHVGDEARFMHQGMTSSRRARHLPRGAADARGRHPARRPRRAARGAEAPRVRAQAHADDRPQPRHPRRADDLRRSSSPRPMPSSPATAPRLVAARDEIATCAISGAVGTFANIDPAVEEHVAEKLGLTPEPISTQVIPRDRHAMFFATLGVIASSIERLAIEIRHLQRTEVLRGRGVFLARPEGLVGDAAQAQPGADREPDRPRPRWCARRWSRRWRMSRCGTSATSRIRRSSASSAPTRRSRSISRSRG